MNEVKRYFRDPGTMARWWKPEDERDPHFAHFREQLEWVVQRLALNGAKEGRE